MSAHGRFHFSALVASRGKIAAPGMEAPFREDLSPFIKPARAGRFAAPEAEGPRPLQKRGTGFLMHSAGNRAFSGFECFGFARPGAPRGIPAQGAMDAGTRRTFRARRTKTAHDHGQADCAVWQSRARDSLLLRRLPEAATEEKA